MIVCDLVVKIGLFQGFSRIKDEALKHEQQGKQALKLGLLWDLCATMGIMDVFQAPMVRLGKCAMVCYWVYHNAQYGET